ncbi:exosome complex RNA-binding protein Csl4 [Stetteria hydrogenophila]
MSSSFVERQVVPGEALASIEEYIPGDGTYVDEEAGLIRAAVAGVARLDQRTRTLTVTPRKRLRRPGPGSSVLGLVTGIRNDLVLVDIYGQLKVQGRLKWLWEFNGRFSGAITIANIADEFVKDIYDYYRPGDIILAKTLNWGSPYHLSTKEPQYGVVFAQCSRCGAPLQPLNQRAMKCPRCGAIEKRKVSIYAGSRILYASLRKVQGLSPGRL